MDKMDKIVIIIIIVLVFLFLLYRKRENFSSNFLPENINGLPDDIKKLFDLSYFLNDFTFVSDNNNYTLINKDISKYQFDIIYHGTNKNLVKGAIAKIPSSKLYYFISLGKIVFKENDSINFTLNLIKERIYDIRQYLLENGISGTQFIYMEFPYSKENLSGIYGIFAIFHSGKILINSSEKYYYANTLNKNVKDKAVFMNKYGSIRFIDFIKNNLITDINVIPNELDEKKNPKNYKLISFKTDKINELNEIFEIF